MFHQANTKLQHTLEFNSSNLDADGNNDPLVPWFRMQQGLHIFGAGMQRSIIYNETGEIGSGGPAIRIVRESGDTRTMQQTGMIRDLKITCSKADTQTSAQYLHAGTSVWKSKVLSESKLRLLGDTLFKGLE